MRSAGATDRRPRSIKMKMKMTSLWAVEGGGMHGLLSAGGEAVSLVVEAVSVAPAAAVDELLARARG